VLFVYDLLFLLFDGCIKLTCLVLFLGYNPNSNAKWMYSKKFKMSMCARKRLRHYVESVEPAISHYVYELNKTFTKLGQRMV
jgi:hypothetical protein